MFAGAGRKQGVVYGAVVGVWNGVLTIILLPTGTESFTAVVVYGQPILQTAFGALGAFIGCLIWKPLPNVKPLAGSRAILTLPPTAKPLSFLNGPIAWFRVFAGAAVATGGTIWANVILELVLEASEGKLTVDSHIQAQLVTWEITALTMLTGGALAGATTLNGLKQGLCVGLGASAIFVGIRLGSSQAQFNALFLSVVASVSLGIVGGWFGGELFPPVISLSRPRRFGQAPI
jgi:hypothetical protein